MKKVVLHLGSNSGQREHHISKAIEAISKELNGITLSSLYETEPWGNKDQSPFLNQALYGFTRAPLLEIWPRLYSIESTFPKKENIHWGPRCIDIDIIYYGQKIHWSNNLEIPHPRLHLRKFVLIPLVEILPDDIHPVFQISNRSLLRRCQDTLEVKKYEPI